MQSETLRILLGAVLLGGYLAYHKMQYGRWL
jgi:hypothetical protein